MARWAARAQEALEESLRLLKPFFGSPTKFDEREEITLVRLSASCYLTSESAAFLISGARLWDAELLCRSVLEGTYKFAFLCHPNPAVRAVRFDEFLIDFPESNRIKKHDRVEGALRSFPMSGREGQPYRDLCLPEVELQELKQRYPGKRRRALSNNWGFVSLAETLAKDGTVALADGLLYSYMASSHLAHKDFESLHLIWEREEREPRRKAALELAHASRELSDLIHLAILRVHVAYELKRVERAPLESYIERQRSFLSDLEQANSDWLDIEYVATAGDR